jgi:hypothetical protein
MQGFARHERSTTVSLPDSRYLGWRPERCDRVALVLQGGGALGAYQAGVYQALHEADIEPDWVSGVSIGAINSALIAGNPRESRLERLQTFWDRITDRKVWLVHARGRHLPPGAQRDLVLLHHADGPARLLRAAPDQPAGSPPPARPMRPASTTPRLCARRCWSWSISI